jgi:hypothetical protein
VYIDVIVVEYNINGQQKISASYPLGDLFAHENDEITFRKLTNEKEHLAKLSMITYIVLDKKYSKW